jgi:adenylate kinase
MKLVFFGPPGSGKGTYASRVAPILGLIHISTGDLFRAEIARGSELGKRAERYIKKGTLVPDEVTIGMLKERIKECKGFILDGFPRTIEQANALEKITRIDMVVNFVLAEDILIEKALARRVCKNCGNTYNVAEIKRGKISMPPLLPKRQGICDKCGGPLVQRADDNEATIGDRIHVYHNQSEPLLKHYREKGLVADIDVIGAPDIMVPIVIEAIKKHAHK